MRFKNVAQFFDRDSCYDGYSGAFLFKAQLASYDGSQPDGTTQRRRTVSLAPDKVSLVPNHKVVLVHSDRWILSNFVQDGFYDQAVRSTAAAKLATGLYDILSPAQAASNAVATRTAYASFDAARELKDPDSSDYDSIYSADLAGTEAGVTGSFFRLGGKFYSVISEVESITGHLECTARQVVWPYASSPTVSVSYAGPFNPVSETYSAGGTFAALAMPRHTLFREDVQGGPEAVAGDTSLLVATSAYTPATGAQLTLAGADWQVEGFVPYQDAWLLHIRRL